MNKQELYANAMNCIIDDVAESVNQKMIEWLEKNPYWEIDDEDKNGNRIFHCPRTSSEDAREAVCEEMVESAYEMGCRDIVEFILHEAVGYDMSNDNKFKILLKKQLDGKIQIASAKEFFDSLTGTKQ